MSYLTVEVQIDHGRVIARGKDQLPDKANGLLTILPPSQVHLGKPKSARKRVKLPLIRGDGKHVINPTPEELDASLWGD